jgi:ornithine carbamoyltransferase
MSFLHRVLLRPSTKIILHFSSITVRSMSASTTSLSQSPRHFLSIVDLTPKELSTLVQQAAKTKDAIKSGKSPAWLQGTLTGKTVAMMFSKRSTRTRVSTEAAIVHMGGHPMFLGKDDIQLGVSYLRNCTRL